jgi:phage N-6-adenine-methyltransferase
MKTRAYMPQAKTTEWETPQELFDQLNELYHFDLDPCATKENAKCKRYYTKADDGLLQSWKLRRVFMNPPYGRKLGAWIEKAVYEARTGGALVVCLIPARTDTRWWHWFVMKQAAAIHFIQRRLHFGKAKNAATFPSAVVVFMPYLEKYQGLAVPILADELWRLPVPNKVKP